jgi:hypothetical protein
MFVPSITGSQPSPQARRPSRQQLPSNSQQQRPQFAEVYQSVALAPPRASDDQSRIPLPRYAPHSSSIPSLASVVNSQPQYDANRTHLDGHASLRSGGNGLRSASLIGRAGAPHSQAELSEAMAAYAASGADMSSSNTGFRGSTGAKSSGSDGRKQTSASARAIAEHNQRISVCFCMRSIYFRMYSSIAMCVRPMVFFPPYCCFASLVVTVHSLYIRSNLYKVTLNHQSRSTLDKTLVAPFPLSTADGPTPHRRARL